MHGHCNKVENFQAFHTRSELSTTPCDRGSCADSKWEAKISPGTDTITLVLKTPNYSLSSGLPPTSKAKLTEKFALKKQAASAIPYLYYFVVYDVFRGSTGLA